MIVKKFFGRHDRTNPWTQGTVIFFQGTDYRMRSNLSAFCDRSQVYLQNMNDQASETWQKEMMTDSSWDSTGSLNAFIASFEQRQICEIPTC